jgi:hypothetical protein
MALALCLLLDRPSERTVIGIWERLEQRGIATLLTHTHGRHVPHLSYAVLREWDLDAVLATLTALPDAGPVEVAVQGTVSFPRGRAALACSVTSATAARQECAVAALRATGADLHRHYEPGHWVPHVSVATGLSAAQLPLAVTAVTDVLPLTIRCDHAALVDTADGRRWPLPGIP